VTISEEAVQELAASLDPEQVKAAHRGMGMPFKFDDLKSEVRCLHHPGPLPHRCSPAAWTCLSLAPVCVMGPGGAAEQRLVAVCL
jgi:hypothetical protein